jgi:hypothetical protein
MQQRDRLEGPNAASKALVRQGCHEPPAPGNDAECVGERATGCKVALSMEGKETKMESRGSRIRGYDAGGGAGAAGCGDRRDCSGGSVTRADGRAHGVCVSLWELQGVNITVSHLWAWKASPSSAGDDSLSSSGKMSRGVQVQLVQSHSSILHSELPVAPVLVADNRCNAERRTPSRAYRPCCRVWHPLYCPRSRHSALALMVETTLHTWSVYLGGEPPE